MGNKTKIEWADSTWSPWRGCRRVSPGCDNCYITSTAPFRVTGQKHGAKRVRASEALLNAPLGWNKKPWVCDLCGSATEGIGESGNCLECGQASDVHRRRVFSLSLGDWLDEEVPIQWLADMLDTIERCPTLDFLLLTKRPENWRLRISRVAHDFNRDYDLADEWYDGKPPPNIWLGVSVENQKEDHRIEELLKIPAKVHFLSCEPLLESVNLIPWLDVDARTGCADDGPFNTIDWCIVGGESGPNARPMNPDWARSLRDQCQAAGVAFFMKQMGGTRKPFPEIPDEIMIRQFPEVQHA